MLRQSVVQACRRGFGRTIKHLPQKVLLHYRDTETSSTMDRIKFGIVNPPVTKVDIWKSLAAG